MGWSYGREPHSVRDSLLLTGIGGADLGFTRLGWRCRWQVEIDPWRRRLLRRHFPDALQGEDVMALAPGDLPAVDLVYAEPQTSELEFVAPLVAWIIANRPPHAVLDLASGHPEPVYAALSRGLLGAGYQIGGGIVQYATAGFYEGRVVTSEPRGRVLFLATHDGAQAVEAIDEPFGVMFGADPEAVRAADEDVMPVGALEAARMFPPGWSCACRGLGGPGWPFGPCACGVQRHAAMRATTSPRLTQFVGEWLQGTFLTQQSAFTIWTGEDRPRGGAVTAGGPVRADRGEPSATAPANF